MAVFCPKARFPLLLAAILMTGSVARGDPLAAASRQRHDAPALAREIDKEVQRWLDKAKVKASGLSDDAEFLRRIHLDLHGVIPPPEKVVVFLDSTDKDKRAKQIDE